jgi:hypothetical protein
VMPSAKDLGGQRFGRWFVLHQGKGRRNGAAWVCECDCGTMRTCQSQSLLRGASKSCGCLQRELLQHRYWINGGSGWAKTSKAGAQQKNDPKGADASANDTGRGLSDLRIGELADWYQERASRLYSPATTAAVVLDPQLRAILHREAPDRVGVEFARVMRIVSFVAIKKPTAS